MGFLQMGLESDLCVRRRPECISQLDSARRLYGILQMGDTDQGSATQGHHCLCWSLSIYCIAI